MVKFRATTSKTSSTVSRRPRNHSSAAMVINSRANLSCMDVSEMVNFACSHKAGSAPKPSGWKKTFACGWELFIMVSSLSAALAISASVGSSGVLGIGGHQGSSSVESSHQCHRLWWLVLHQTRDLLLYPLLLLVP